MTEKLSTLLHEQASAPAFDPVDLDALVATGERRLRRRRWSGVAAGAVAAVAAVALTPGLISADGQPTGPASGLPAAAGPAEVGLTWSVDRVIHHGSQVVDVGRPIDAFVRTSAGYVLASTGEVWAITGDQTTRVGTIDDTRLRLRLVTDEQAAQVAWVDTTGTLVVLDQLTGTTTPYDVEGASDLYALDDRTVYFADRRGVMALDLRDGTVDLLPGEATSRSILDVEAGLLARGAADGTTFASAHATEYVQWTHPSGSLGAFSSDGRYYSADADDLLVYDVGRGQEVRMDLDGYTFAAGYGWVGERELAVLAMKSGADDLELLSCVVPEGSCTEHVTLGTEQYVEEHVQLPFGQPIAD